jgi:hypothetical protein
VPGAAGGGSGAPPRKPPAPAAPMPASPEPDRAAQQTSRLTGLYRENEEAILRQRAAYQQSTMAIAAQRNEMRDAGVMSQKFIDQARQGNVPLREWAYQMGTITSKFAGWTAAGSAVYGAVNAVGRIGGGAKVSGGIEGGLGRSIDNLDTDKAKQDVRDLSRQYNVSMAEAEQAVQLASQRFGDLDASVEAAKVTLAGFKVGDLSIEDSANYTTALANGLGLGITNAKELQLIFDQINEGQNKFGVSIKDTFQGSAKAAGTWVNAGGSFSKLLALVGGIEKTTGRTGQQAGTALQRSVGLIQRPQNQQELAKFGINTAGTIDEIYDQAFDVAEDLIKQGKKGRINDLANALSTPQLAPYIAPLLANRKVADEQEATYRRQVAGGGGSAQKELETQLSRFEERVKAGGNALERLGGELEQSGLLNAVGGLVVGFTGVVNLTNEVLDAFNSLPGPVREVASTFLVANGALAVSRKFAPAGLGGALGAGLIAPSETQALRKALTTTLQEEAKDLAGAKVKTDVGVRTAQREGLIAENMIGRTSRERGALTAAGKAVPPELIEQEALAVKERRRALDAATAGQIRSTSLQQQLDLATADLARAERARTAAELKSLTAERNAPLLETLDRPTTKPLTTFNGSGERTLFEAGEAGAAGAGGAAQAAYARNTAAAADAAGETAKAQRAAAAAVTGSGAVEAVGLWGKSNAAFRRFLKSGPELGDAVAAASTTLGHLQTGTGGGRGPDFKPLGNGLKAGATRLGTMVRGIGTTIGPLGAFGIALGGGIVAVNALKKSWKHNADLADHFATTQIVSSKQESDELARARKAASKVDPDIRRRAESGQFVPKVVDGRYVADDKEKAALDLIARQAIARRQPSRRDLVDSVTNTKGTGDFDRIVKQMRDDPAALRDFKSARDKAIADAEKLGKDLPAVKAAVAKINDLYQDTLTRLAGDALDPKTLLTDNQIDLQGLADAAGARTGVDPARTKPLATAIQANLALAAQARGKGDFAGIAKARDALNNTISSWAQEGLEDSLAISRSSGETDAAYARAGQRLREAESRARDTKVDHGLAEQMRDRERLIDTKRGQLSQTADNMRGMQEGGTLTPEVAERFRKQAENLAEQIKTLEEADVKDATRLRELRATRKETIEKVQALQVQNERQRFEAAEAVTDARNQVAVNSAAAGAPRIDLQLRQIGEKLARTIRVYGRDSAQAYGAMAEQQQLQQQAVQDQFATLQARGALAEALVSNGSPQAQAGVRIGDLQKQLAFMQGHRDTYSDADILNQMASIESAKRQNDEQIEQDARDYLQAVGEYRKSLTTDPVKQAAIDYETAQKVYAAGDFKNPAERLQKLADRNQKKQAYKDLKNQTAYDDIEYFASIGKATREQEIAQLERLLKTRKLNKQLSRQVKQRIYQLKNEADSDSGNFDLNVGDLTIPSVSQIRSTVLGRHQGVSITNQNTAQVYVNSAADIPAVAKVLEDHQTGIGRAEARAMGVR